MANGNNISRQIPEVARPASVYTGRDWPTTREGITEEWARRMESALGLAYRNDEVKRLNLFRALDASGNLIAETRRVLPLVRFVVGVDAAALATRGLSWQVEPSRAPDMGEDQIAALAKAGSAVWERSKMQQRIPSWAWDVCAVGDWFLEVVKSNRGAVVVAHDPRRVRVETDPLGLEITRAVIDVTYVDGPTPDAATGALSGGGKDHVYRRVLTPERIDVYIDGEYQKEPASGPNALGVVPLVPLRFRQVGEYELSSWAGDGAEDAVAMIDSMLTQIQVTGGRHANPLLVALGAQIAEGSDLTQVGRTASLPAGADLKWLEATLQGVRELGAAAEMLLGHVMEAYPEFLFVDAGASSSGTALSYRAGAFVAKIEPVRQAFYAALSTALGMAVALDAGEAWSEAADLYRVAGGSALPQDVGAMADLLRSLVADGLMRPQDAVAKLQTEGVIPDDLEPAAYLAEAQVAASDREAGQIRTAMAVAEAARALEVEPVAVDAAPAGGPAPDAAAGAADALADTALNGAQVEAAVGIVEKVALGQLPRESGIAMLVDFFQLDTARAERVMGSIGRGFTPDTVSEPAAPLASQSEIPAQT